jgi:antitoxin component HigA of HigAB toxin-antitoxin module
METGGSSALERFRGLRPAADVLSRRVENESVLVDLATNRIFSLNETAARFWELLQEGLTPMEACFSLQEEFDVTEAVLTEEIGAFCELLERERLASRTGD